jgi:hypothetical protein
MPKGGFAILALDQRESLRQMLAEGQRKVLVMQLKGEGHAFSQKQEKIGLAIRASRCHIFNDTDRFKPPSRIL